MQDIAGKHGLTPDWKETHDPPAKRLQTSKSEINTASETSSSGKF